MLQTLPMHCQVLARAAGTSAQDILLPAERMARHPGTFGIDYQIPDSVSMTPSCSL